MAVKIRIKKEWDRKKDTFYRIVVADSRAPREWKVHRGRLEIYDPKP